MSNSLPKIDIRPDHWEIVRDILQKNLPNVTVWAFGSRVKWTTRRNSDLDLVVFSTPEQKRKVADLKEALEESSLPFPVDVLIWNDIPDDFKNNIQQKYAVLFQAKSNGAENEGKHRVMGSEWKEVLLSDYCDFISGFAFKSEDLSDIEGIPVVKIKNVNNKIVTLDGVQYFPKVKLTEKLHKFLLSNNDVLIAMTGQGSVGRVGRFTNKTGAQVLINQRVGKFLPRKNLDLGYLYYILSSNRYEKILFNAASGSGQPNLSPETITSLYIPYLPLIEQIKVTHVLSLLDEKIEINRQINQTLEQMAQALFKSWFVDFDPVIDNALDAGNPIPESLQARAELRQAVREENDFKPLPKAIRELFPDEFEESELGWIPKDWGVSNVGKEFDITMGQSPPGSTYNEIGEGMPFFQGKTDFGFRFPSNRIYCTDPKRIAYKNDTLISVRAPVGSINLAAKDCIIGRGLAAARHKSKSVSFTFYAMNNLANYFEVFEGEGTVFGSINQKDFSALPQLSFSEELIRVFDVYCSDLDIKIGLSSRQIEELTKLRDTLLPRLISGELSLSDIELD